MKKTLADALRALARRLDPPAPMTVHVYGVPTTTSASQVSWTLRTGR